MPNKNRARNSSRSLPQDVPQSPLKVDLTPVEPGQQPPQHLATGDENHGVTPVAELPQPEEAGGNLGENYWLWAMPILLVGIIVRQWALGAAPFHPDEAVHAFFAQRFASYSYDPIYHGPVLYHLVTACFALFGENDFSARLAPSLLGVLLLWMVLGPARRLLGDRGALVCAALLAVSPAMVAYSRRLLHDSLVLVLTLGAVLCFLQMLEHPVRTAAGRRARVGLAVFLTLFLATKANFFFILAVLLIFGLIHWASGLTHRKFTFVAPAWIVPVVWLHLLVGAVVWPRANSVLPAVQKSQHFCFQVLTVEITLLLIWWLAVGALRRKTIAPAEESKGISETETASCPAWWNGAWTFAQAGAAAVALYLFLYGNGAQILAALAQHDPTWTAKLAEGRGHATFAVDRMLDYWGKQQAAPRLPGRHDYYFVLALLYEVPIVLFSLGAVWHAARRRTREDDFLLWWAFASWGVYAVANEKVPWLLVHMLPPLALLCGRWAVTWDWSGLRKRRVAALPAAAAVLALAFDLRGVSATCFERSGDNGEPIFFAHSPEAFSDAVQEGLLRTVGDPGVVYYAKDRQWPTAWYLRANAPNLNGSRPDFTRLNLNDLRSYRMVIVDDALWRSQFERAGWQGSVMNFLIWPRASWGALAPQRYFLWQWNRDTVPREERLEDPSSWTRSILSNGGEWSAMNVGVGTPPVIPPLPQETAGQSP